MTMQTNADWLPLVPTPRPPFASRLGQGRERFLAHAIDHAFACGRRTADDFVRHFPPSLIMKSLCEAPALRAKILVRATGINESIALRKSLATALQDVQLALEEGDIDAKTIAMLLAPDDRVRHLCARRLWSFLTEGDFWRTDPRAKSQFETAQLHLAFLLECAIHERLISYRDVIDGLSVSELVARLPKSALERIIVRALVNGRNGGRFDDADLLTASSIETIVRYVPMPHIWARVVEPRIARAHAFVDAGDDFELISIARGL